MKKLLAGTFAAALLAVGVSAQTPQAPPQDPPAQETKPAAKALTVTGCLKAGDTPESFMLSDLKWKDDKPVGTSGATAPAPPPVAATSLKLIGNPTTKLSEHVGHTVEVTGTIDQAGKAMGSAAPTEPAARPSASAPTALSVSNLRMIAATCPAQ